MTVALQVFVLVTVVGAARDFNPVPYYPFCKRAPCSTFILFDNSSFCQ